VFLGPLIQGAAVAANTEQPSRPTQALLLDASKAALRLTTGGTGAGDWVIRSSRPAENFVIIAQGWVDNAWDIQTRRGPDATARKEWTELLGILP
jgi:hypothetical protein